MEKVFKRGYCRAIYKKKTEITPEKIINPVSNRNRANIKTRLKIKANED